jgi:hypothetical protein
MVSNSDKLPQIPNWFHQLQMAARVDKVFIKFVKKFGQTHSTNICILSFLLKFWNQGGRWLKRPWCWLAFTRHNQPKKKSWPSCHKPLKPSRSKLVRVQYRLQSDIYSQLYKGLSFLPNTVLGVPNAESQPTSASGLPTVPRGVIIYWQAHSGKP